jgi:hypothetical protein
MGRTTGATEGGASKQRKAATKRKAEQAKQAVEKSLYRVRGKSVTKISLQILCHSARLLCPRVLSMGGLAVDTHELITQLLLFGVIAAGNKFLSELKRRVEASAFLQKREVQAAGVLAVAVAAGVYASSMANLCVEHPDDWVCTANSVLERLVACARAAPAAIVYAVCSMFGVADRKVKGLLAMVGALVAFAWASMRSFTVGLAGSLAGAAMGLRDAVANVVGLAFAMWPGPSPTPTATPGAVAAAGYSRTIGPVVQLPSLASSQHRRSVTPAGAATATWAAEAANLPGGKFAVDMGAAFVRWLEMESELEASPAEIAAQRWAAGLDGQRAYDVQNAVSMHSVLLLLFNLLLPVLLVVSDLRPPAPPFVLLCSPEPRAL